MAWLQDRGSSDPPAGAPGPLQARTVWLKGGESRPVCAEASWCGRRRWSSVDRVAFSCKPPEKGWKSGLRGRCGAAGGESPGSPGISRQSAVGPPPDCSPVARETCTLGEATPQKKVARVAGGRPSLRAVVQRRRRAGLALVSQPDWPGASLQPSQLSVRVSRSTISELWLKTPGNPSGAP